jgi:hypothetical protein
MDFLIRALSIALALQLSHAVYPGRRWQGGAFAALMAALLIAYDVGFKPVALALCLVAIAALWFRSRSA